MIRLSNILTEALATIKTGSVTGKYAISANNNIIRFIPDGATMDRLMQVSKKQIQDELQAYCETKTGLKFSPVWNDEGAGYAFEVDMYSVREKLQGKL